MKKIIRMTAVLMLAAIILCGCAEKGEDAGEGIERVENPWVEITEEEAEEKSGVGIEIPSAATDIAYRYCEDCKICEIDFVLYGMEFTARIAQTEEEKDISGAYYSFEEGDDRIGPYEIIGKEYHAKDSDEFITLGLWFDESRKNMFSLLATSDECYANLEVAQIIFS